MNVKVEEVMVTPVISTHERKSIGHAKEIMLKKQSSFFTDRQWRK